MELKTTLCNTPSVIVVVGAL